MQTGDASGRLTQSGNLLVETVELARFCAEPVDFLKLDIEGAEFDVIHQLCRSDAITRVRRVFVELHEWSGTTPRFHELLGAMDRAGFNYRVPSAVALGDTPQPAGFIALAHPTNLAALYAWRD